MLSIALQLPPAAMIMTIMKQKQGRGKKKTVKQKRETMKRKRRREISGIIALWSESSGTRSGRSILHW
jgi:hypothetical protein